MTFAFKGSGGIATSSALNQTTATLTTTGTAGAFGDLAVIVYAVDNNATVDGDENAVLGITCNTGNVWIKAKEFTNGQLASGAGATCGLWYTNLKTAQPLGTVITISFGDPPARDASAVSLTYFSKDVNSTAAVEATATLAVDGSGIGSLNATTTDIACLRIRATASESISNTPWTKTAAFDGLFTIAATASGGSAVNQGIRAEYDISTGTGVASSPTSGAGAADHASVYVAFREVAIQTLTPSLYAPADTFFTSTVMAAPIYCTPGTVTAPDEIFATDTLSVNLIIHPGGISIDEIVPPAAANQTAATVPLYFDQDFLYLPDVLSVNWIHHNPVSIDEIIPPAATHQTEATVPRYFDQDFLYLPELSTPPVFIHPIAFEDLDNIRHPLAAAPAKIVPPRHVDVDVFPRATLTQYLVVTALHVDTDTLIPPFIGRRRTQVRSGVGILQGTITNVIDLVGDRDKAA